MRNPIKVQSNASNNATPLYTVDYLSVINDDELIQLDSELRNKLDKMSRQFADTTQLEVELSYVQREWQIRRARTAAHRVWVDRSRWQLAEEERNLPPFIPSTPPWELFAYDDEKKSSHN